MDLMALDSVLLEQKDEARKLREGGGLVDREVEKDQLMGFLARPNILALLGVRRSGKSTLSHILLRDVEYGYVNFDDERFHGITSSDLNDVLEGLYRVYGDTDYLLFDEIQNVEGWELFANRLRRTKRIIITGSNANLLSGELATHLTGRYIDFELYPFSFVEYLAFTGSGRPDAFTTRETARMKKALEDYLETGGFPEVLAFGPRMARRIYSDIITKDILARHDIRNRPGFEELARYMVSNTGNEFTYSKLRRVFDNTKVDTIRGYIGHLRSSFLLIVLERYSPKLKQQIIAPRKGYCIDNGIVGAVGHRSSDNLGARMENAVAVELHRRKGRSADEPEIFYWKDHQQREVDFVVKEGTQIVELIQVTYAHDRRDLREREVVALRKAAEDLRCEKMTTVTWGYEGTVDGVEFIPLWKWLLG